jgi:phage shock protein C
MRDVFSDSREIYLDPVHKKLGGVCAGVANYLDVPRLYVRIAAVIALLVFSQATLIAYGLAYLILEEEPLDGEYKDLD